MPAATRASRRASDAPGPRRRLRRRASFWRVSAFAILAVAIGTAPGRNPITLTYRETGHVLAYGPTVTSQIRKAATGMMQTLKSGEGFVFDFTGPGWVMSVAGCAVGGAVAAGVAMVPQGLVLLTSVAFAVGVIRLGRRNVLVQELPFAHSDDLELGKLGDELLVRVGPYRRSLLLPDTLRNRPVIDASLVEGELRVVFAREAGQNRDTG